MVVNRPLYLDRLRRWRDKDVIKVVTGVRRCGKSTLLKLFAEELLADGVSPDRVVAINLEQLENEGLLDYHRLHDEVLARVRPGGTNYVLIDEIQNVPEFQRAVDSLYTREDIDLYITGSNAVLLSGTLATLLSGRYVEVAMQPFSFSEYVAATGETSPSLMRLYRRYISQGSFPATLAFAQDALALHDYLEGILNTVLLKDVAQRLNIANTLGLGALATFMFDSIGNLVSAKKISDCLGSQGSKVSPNTVGEYLSGLSNSFIFYPVKRFDVRGKRLLKLQEKYYAVDMGMRRMALSNQVRDTGRILENVVFLELRRRYGQVFIGRVGDLEVDFVANGPDGPLYVQVAETVMDERTLGRELASLEAVSDNYPKLLLTLDDMDPQSHGGIVQRNALEWLMEV